MKICLSDPNINYYADLVEALLKKGVVVTNDCESDYDAILNFTAFNVNYAIDIHKKYPHIPVINYVWDYYKFAHEGKHWFDWKPYVSFLRESKILLAPSSGQQLRLKELLELDSTVLHTGIRVKDHPIMNDGYVLDHMRWYPEKNKDWIVNACAELGIPCIHSEHQYSQVEFEKLVANSSFLACGYEEASTGGLTLIEGLWNGKTALLSDSPYMGGKDYMGDFATYFDHTSYEDLKVKLKQLYENPPQIDIKKARKYIQDNFSFDVMADKIITVVNHLKS